MLIHRCGLYHLCFQVSVAEAKETVNLWYKERKEVLKWQQARKKEARENGRVYTLLGRARVFPSLTDASSSLRGHVERAAINTPVQVLSFFLMRLSLPNSTLSLSFSLPVSLYLIWVTATG
jgi:hypothetical protein